MTTGEMLQWTNRLNSILSGYPGLKDERLANMMTDLERAYGIPALYSELYEMSNPFVISLYHTVSDERSL